MMEFEEAVEEILANVDADREEIEKKLKEFIEYGVPVEQAKNALIKKYGTPAKEKKIKDIGVNERNIITKGKVLTIEEREVEVRGSRRKIYRGLLGDDTAVIPFTAWKDFGISKGDVIRIRNASSSEWLSQPRLSLSEWTVVEKIDEDIELVKRQPRKYNLIDIRPGLSNVEVRGKIESIEKREVSIGDETKTVFSGIIKDETAVVPFTAWKDFELAEGDAIRIKGAYIRAWRGAPQLIFDENAEVEKIDEDIEYMEHVIPIYKVVERGGGIRLVMEGDVLEIRKDSGIIFRCPQCGRKIREGVCEEHGQVEGVADLRIRAIIDDSTGAVDVIFNRDIAEKLLGKSMDDYLKVAEEAMDYGIVHEEIVDKLLFKTIRVKGDSIQSEFIVSIIAREADIVEIDVKEEAEQLLMEMG
ncbi:MAG: hypothetical protein J7K61_00990 [Thermoplasmata archaeon]|nr:hypothetical protein [Thermoplasmata archaeon]